MGCGHAIPVAVLLGPTGVGKTSVAVALAEQLQADIVSCDSRQVYRGMDIGTASPTREQQARARHWLVDVVEPSDTFSSHTFACQAREAIRDLHSRGRRALVCGGTGLYFRALTEEPGPAVPPDAAFREKMRQRVAKDGRNVIFSELNAVDPATAARLHPNDTQRVIRALEVHHTTGVPLSELHKRTRPTGEFDFSIARAVLPRAELYARINTRVEHMMRDGLWEEFKALRELGYGQDSPGMQCLGYHELFDVEREALTLAEVVPVIQMNTRRYAKKQITWLNNQVSGVAIDFGASDAPRSLLRQYRGFFGAR